MVIMKSIALVTGGNRGLGLATVAALARAGCTVIAAGRDGVAVEAAVERLREQGLTVEPSGRWTWRRCRASPKLPPRSGSGTAGWTSLVNNAGILPEAASAGDHDFVDPAVLAHTFETNVFGAVAVIESFLPLLRVSAAGRIVNVSSTMGSLADQCDPDSPYYGTLVPAYQASKAALNSITIGLSKKLCRHDPEGHVGLPGLGADRPRTGEPRGGAGHRGPGSRGDRPRGQAARRTRRRGRSSTARGPSPW